ncbi:MAG TPA: ATP-binding protein, partial [Bdellovibrio sp.]|nr:ATP-binding protein [Bdellovibrio sp.]
DYRQNRIPTFLPLVRKHQIIATKDSNVDSDLAKTESIAAAPSLSKEEDLMSPAQRAFALFMDGKSLLGTEPQQAKEIMSSNDVLEELVMNLVVDASEDDKKKTQIEKGLCYQYFNSSGAVQKFWHRVAQKAFEKSPKELAKVYPETQKLLEITYPNPELKTPSSKQQLGFPGVAGMDELKKDLELEIINPWKDDADPDVIIEKPNGCLFFGPSRTGKTHMAKALAHELGYAPDEIIHVNARDLIEPDQGKSMQNIGRLFDDAKSQPNGAVIHIDEIDALTPKRKDVQTHHAEMPQIVSQFVTEMDEVGKQGVFMIGTTNHLNVIDNALTEPGRFDFQLPIGLPDQTAR